MIRIARTTLTRLAAASLALGLLGAASAAPVLVIGRKPQPDLAHVAALDTLRGLPGLTQDRGLSVVRAYGEDDEDCLAVARRDSTVLISCAR